MTLAHRAVSFSTSLVISCGVLGRVSIPCSASFSFTSGSFRILVTSALIRLMTAAGVRRGPPGRARSRCRTGAGRPRPWSGHRPAGWRAGCHPRRARAASGADVRQQRVDGTELQIDLPGQHVGDGRRRALVGDVGDVGARHRLEELRGQMLRAAGARRGISELARSGLRERHEFLHGRGLHVRVRYQHDRHRAELRDLGEIARDGVRRLRQQHRIDGHGVVVGDQQLVAVRRGLGHVVGPDASGRACLVVHDDRLVPDLAEPLADHAGDDVVAPAGSEGHDEGDRLGGIVLLCDGRVAEACGDHGGGREQRAPSGA